MNKIVLSLVAAFLLVGLIFSPAMASTTETCGDTYTVKSGDYLSKIARTCGVSLSSLISANPQISNLNRIYPGQVIRIKAGATIPTPTTPPATGTTYTVQRGDTLYKISVRYGVTLQSLLAANTNITNASRIYVGQVIKIPTRTGTDSGLPVTGSRISISNNRVKPGTTVEVRVWSFPANASIDLRIGKEGQAYTSVVDARTNASGGATIQVTIPSTAKSGEKWVIKAMTTELRYSAETTSPVITIIQ